MLQYGHLRLTKKGYKYVQNKSSINLLIKGLN